MGLYVISMSTTSSFSSITLFLLFEYFDVMKVCTSIDIPCQKVERKSRLLFFPGALNTTGRDGWVGKVKQEESWKTGLWCGTIVFVVLARIFFLASIN